MRQEALINKLDWDYLIILDACRADCFESLYWFEGNYRRVISPSSYTLGWLCKTFPKRYDVTYFSANPLISSKGDINPFRNLKKFSHSFHLFRSLRSSKLKSLGLVNSIEPFFMHFKASNHFKKIIDLWAYERNEKLKTIHPNSITKFVLKVNPTPKAIIHYLQPHLPYFGSKEFMRFWKSLNFFDLNVEIAILKAIERKELTLYLLKEAYILTLEETLKAVEKLVRKLGGRIIITSDHGELLGEYGGLFHPNLPLPELRIVPWLELKGRV